MQRQGIAIPMTILLAALAGCSDPTSAPPEIAKSNPLVEVGFAFQEVDGLDSLLVPSICLRNDFEALILVNFQQINGPETTQCSQLGSYAVVPSNVTLNASIPEGLQITHPNGNGVKFLQPMNIQALEELAASIPLIPEELLHDSKIHVVSPVYYDLVKADGSANFAAQCFRLVEEPKCVETPPGGPDLMLIDGQRSLAALDSEQAFVINTGNYDVKVLQSQRENIILSRSLVMLNLSTDAVVVVDAPAPWWGDSPSQAKIFGDPAPFGWSGLPEIRDFHAGEKSFQGDPLNPTEGEIELELGYDCSVDWVEFRLLSFLEGGDAHPLPVRTITILDGDNETIYEESIPRGEHWSYRWEPVDDWRAEAFPRLIRVTDDFTADSKFDVTYAAKGDTPWEDIFTNPDRFDCLAKDILSN